MSCTGRFWEGRFKSQALLDEAVVLTAMSYVDLNPIRAGIAQIPEASDFTSIQQRIARFAKQGKSKANDSQSVRLMSLTSKATDKHPNLLAFSTRDYLELVDWAGRAAREDEGGAIAAHLPPLLERPGLDPRRYLEHVQGKGRRAGGDGAHPADA